MSNEKSDCFKLKVFDYFYTITLQFYLVVLPIRSQQEDKHPAISWVFQQQLARTAALRGRTRTGNSQEIILKKCRKTYFWVLAGGLIPSERSYWRGWSTVHSFSHSQEHLCPVRRAEHRLNCPVLGPQSEVRSLKFFQGWMPPPPSLPLCCIPTDKPWREKYTVYNDV